mgnify:CR=1 FL=1
MTKEYTDFTSDEINSFLCKCSKDNLEWIKFLTEIGSMEDFKKLINPTLIVYPIKVYREYLQSLGYDDVSYEQIEKSYNNQKMNDLRFQLEILFLESIDEKDFENYVKTIKHAPNGLKKLYNEHIKHPNSRIARAIVMSNYNN